MPKIRRAHHLVPRFLLAGFTESLDVRSRLSVSDLRTGKQWWSKPENCGHKRDFYSVEKLKIPKDAVEEILGDIEGKAAPLVRGIVRNRALPARGTEQLKLLLAFIGLLATRGPVSRSRVNESLDQLAWLLLEREQNPSDSFERFREAMLAQGSAIEDLPTLEDISRLADRREYRFELSKDSHLRRIFESAELIVPYLVERKWSILVSTSGSFICSDEAVSLSSSVPMKKFSPLGYAHHYTEVTVPLDRSTMLIGSYNNRSPIEFLNRIDVAYYNTLRATQGDRFLFAGTHTFPWLDSNRCVRLGSAGLGELIATRPKVNVGSLFDKS